MRFHERVQVAIVLFYATKIKKKSGFLFRGWECSPGWLINKLNPFNRYWFYKLIWELPNE